MGTDDGDPEDSLPLVARELLQRLRRRADRKVAHALLIVIDQLAGYKAAEIRDRHALTDAEYKLAYQWAREELAQMRDEQNAGYVPSARALA